VESSTSAKIPRWRPRTGEYVGRPVRGRRRSPLGNPFKIRDESERAGAIESYDRWLREKINAGDRDVARELDVLAAISRRENRLVRCPGALFWWTRLSCSLAPLSGGVSRRLKLPRL
jgi:hypothetical protein